MELQSLEICAGAGGQALGLEAAGFEHAALVEIDKWATATLRYNRPRWSVIEADLLQWQPDEDLVGIDLLAGGVPCPPFSKAGKQLGPDDERNLFDRAIDLVEELGPRAVMLENVRGLLDPVFADYRSALERRLTALGYQSQWRLVQASDFGVPQLRPRSILIAAIPEVWEHFEWPAPHVVDPPTVGDVLAPLMEENGWMGARTWAQGAHSIAPTVVGGSKKHGGPDLGPTRARKAWAQLGVNGSTLAESAPEPSFDGAPRLTVRMAAAIQGFPADWHFVGAKTNAYRQVGNAFPPPVAQAVGEQLASALRAANLQRASA